MLKRIFPLSIIFVFPLQVAAETGTGYYYHFYKVRVELAQAPGQVAIFHPNESRKQVRGLLNQAGYHGSNLRAMSAARGWTISVLRSASSSPRITNTRHALSRLLEHSMGRYFLSPVFVDSLGKPVVLRQDILMRFQPNTDDQAMQEVIQNAGIHPLAIEPFGGMEGAYRISPGFDSGLDVLTAANRLALSTNVVFAEPDVFLTAHSSGTPNDPLFEDMWHLENTGQFGGVVDVDIDATTAFTYSTGDPSIIVVILDVGVQQDHPDINQIPGKDFFFQSTSSDGGPVHECDNHGTPVAGVVSAIINNGIGVVGVAPNAVIASARIGNTDFPCDGLFDHSPSAVVNGLDWAEQIGARVVVASFEVGYQSPSEAEKFMLTRENGIIIFGAAGNDSEPVVPFPARYDGVIAVSGIEPDGSFYRLSNFGDDIVFTAPADVIPTTDRTGADGWRSDDDYVLATGTSFAASIAAGVAALILSVMPNLDPSEVEEIMRLSAVDFGLAGWDPQFGWGLVNAAEAIRPLAEIFLDGFELGDTSSWSN